MTVAREPFDPPRYATRGVMKFLSPEVQFTLWAMIDLLRLRGGARPDYLQIFELSPSDGDRGDHNQTVVHRQGQPTYLATTSICVADPVAAKIYVIDDGTHCTMLLAEEY